MRGSGYYEPFKRYSVQFGFINQLEAFAVDDRYHKICLTFTHDRFISIAVAKIKCEGQIQATLFCLLPLSCLLFIFYFFPRYFRTSSFSSFSSTPHNHAGDTGTGRHDLSATQPTRPGSVRTSQQEVAFYRYPSPMA